MFMRLLGACRFLLLIPVIGCLFLTLGVVLMGVGRIVTSGTDLVQKGDFSAKAAKTMSLAVIEIIDLFLIGTVSYIAAVGLYKLFIGRADIKMPMRLQINTLKDLEDKIIGVIVAALAVAFLGHAAGGDPPDALLNYGAGIAVMIATLAFFMNYGGKKPSPNDEK
jgi:uncharacterized membrane protein YqhA